MELEKVKRQVEVAASAAVAEPLDDMDEGEFDEVAVTDNIMTDVEDIQVVTKLTMQSRKLKVKISTELLHELDRLQVNFKLN